MLVPSLAHAQLPPQQLMVALDANTKLDPTLRGFYIARGYRPLWIEGDAPNQAAEALYRLIATAQFDGLSRKALQADKLRGYLRRARWRCRRSCQGRTGVLQDFRRLCPGHPRDP